ncbi:bifunctional diguanylate cyclase/phosphodiesterase [Oceanimonas doudoroffii]|uniref:Signal transduction protein n=1 Tax=Oceanimonas doudoroffii TaxID=84158 RepID=A0A233RAS1_9GAMM|nr:EAL domain-containing protein [Oceanimonas doudoroffii]OXY80486.1 signal transduction protein [Oceanimonas doudoroffii]
MPTFRLSSLYILMAFVCIFAAGVYYTHLSIMADRKELRLLMEEVVGVQAAAIERRLTRSLSSTYILAQEVRRSNGQFRDFDKFAEEVIQTLGGVSNLQLAPNGITERIYPLAGNEKGIGHNLLRHDVRRKEAIQAIESKKLTLAGPFMLVQGRMGMVGRNPVFLEQNGDPYFWGFATALIYLDDLLAFTELDQLQQKGYAYELSRLHPDTGKVDIFARSTSGLDKQQVAKTIRVPNGEWTITMSRPASFTLPVVLGIIFSLLIATLFALLMRRILREPERLRLLVKQQTVQLEHLAFNDDLTGLANRRFFTEQLERTILHCQREGESLALMYLDLDDFKRINDSTGHDDGDRLLIEVALRLRAAVRKSDLVGRLGGDEFAVVLMNIKRADNARMMAEKIIASISKPIKLAQHEAVVGASIGITLAPEDGTSSGELMRNADLAMYDSKRAGKNQFSFYNPKMQEQALHAIHLEEELRQAVCRQEFALMFQPIIALEHGRTEKFEALLRWNHPQRGMQAPGSFIDTAEQTGLIVPIGYWVIEAACKFVRRQMHSGHKVRPVAVNLSVCQLREADFADRVEALLIRLQIPPELLELEITESMLMENVDLALVLIEHLKRLGIRISIDDFGTGYSSLSQLRQFPVNSLKIDRSFVRDLESSPIDRQMVEAITAMVHKLDLKVVAEGIETEQQMRFLRTIGCDYGQGFLFARPLATEQALHYHGHASLARNNTATDTETCNLTAAGGRT